MSTLLEDIKPYIDPKTGGVTATDGGSDNEQLFSAILFELSGDNTALSSVMKVCTPPSMGLYPRYPGVMTNSVDNYIGITTLLPYLVNYYGSRHFWSFNVANPGHFSLSTCYLRFIGFRPYVLMINNTSVGILSQFLFSVAILSTLFTGKTNVSNIQLQWLMNRGVKGKHRLVDLSIKLWQYLAMKRWPGGMSEVFGIYHGTNHPFAVYGPKDFT